MRSELVKMKKSIIIQIRSLIGSNPDTRKTLELLRLGIKNNALICSDDEVHRGMFSKVKDYCTWGKLSDENFEKILSTANKVEECKNNKNQISSWKLRLNPPRKGFDGIFKPYVIKTKKGTLGNREEDIMELLERML